MSRRLTGQADSQAGSRSTAAQGHGWPGGGPVTRSPAYPRVRWMLTATHIPVHYGAVGNIAAPGSAGRTGDREQRRGRAPLATAGDYQRHYETEVNEHLRAVSGFRAARLLRRDDDREVMVTSITFFTSQDATRGFAGDDFELAVVEETTRQALSRWDERVSHHRVVADLE